jgi:hypothetical protein
MLYDINFAAKIHSNLIYIIPEHKNIEVEDMFDKYNKELNISEFNVEFKSFVTDFIGDDVYQK